MARLTDGGSTWFPGQMARTRRLIRENLPLVGLVIEVADARAPRATRYPALEKLVPGRPILTVLGKADLADPPLTADWVKTIAGGEAVTGARSGPAGPEGAAGPPHAAVAFSSTEPRDAREVLRLAGVMALRRSRQADARAMVVGLPNVGKSTLINRLVGRSAARTGDRPGVTRGKQWLRAGPDLLLLDLPGVLVPGRLPGRVSLTLALVGILPREAFDPVEVATHALGVLLEAGRLPPELAERSAAVAGAGGSASGPGGWSAARREGNASLLTNLLRRYALVRGHLRAGGEPDLERAAVALVGAFREGRFGRLTLERPAGRTSDPTPPEPRASTARPEGS